MPKDMEALKISVKMKIFFHNYLEELFRINTFFTEFFKLGNYFRTILRISHAEPLRGGVEHFASGLSVLDEFVDHQRNEKFAILQRF